MSIASRIIAGTKVIVKVGRNEVEAIVIEATDTGWKVKSQKTGREFEVCRIVRVIEEPAPEMVTPETETEPAAEETKPETETEPAAEETKPETETEPTAEETKPTTETEPTAEEVTPETETKPAAEEVTPETETEPTAEEAKPDEDHAVNPAPESGRDQKPPKKISLLTAAAMVLAACRKPMNCKEIIAKAIEMGLWTPTGAKTPEQTLYGGIFREIKTTEKPRFKKSETRKGSFEYAPEK